MMRRVAVLVLLAGSLAGFTGCRSVDQPESLSITNPFRITPERPLADVPVPSGFTLRSSASYVFTGNYRVAKLCYRGTPSMDDVVEYLKQQMPASRWALVKEGGTDGRALSFHNDLEEMSVTLGRAAGITGLEIEIKPRRL